MVLVVQPQTGDELQWEKAGILEIADVIVVNKSDLPGADHTIADIAEQMHTRRWNRHSNIKNVDRET